MNGSTGYNPYNVNLIDVLNRGRPRPQTYQPPIGVIRNPFANSFALRGWGQRDPNAIFGGYLKDLWSQLQAKGVYSGMPLPTVPSWMQVYDQYSNAGDGGDGGGSL